MRAHRGRRATVMAISLVLPAVAALGLTGGESPDETVVRVAGADDTPTSTTEPSTTSTVDSDAATTASTPPTTAESAQTTTTVSARPPSTTTSVAPTVDTAPGASTTTPTSPQSTTTTSTTPPRPTSLLGRVLFVRWGSMAEVWSVGLDGSDVRRELTDVGVGQIDLSPNGKWIVYVRFLPEDPGLNGFNEVRIIRVDGTGDRAVTPPGWWTEPRFSPDGRRILMGGDCCMEPTLWVVDIDGTDLRQVDVGPSYVESASWAPDSERLVVDLQYRPGLWVTAVSGGPLDEIYAGEAWQPAWAPSGNTIVFNAGAGAGLYYVDGASEVVSHLVTGSAGAPAWSPDGDLVVYECVITNSDGGWQLEICAVDAAGGAARRLTVNYGGESYGPTM